MSDPIETRLIKIIASVIKRDENLILPNSRFIEDLGANSLDLVEMVSLAGDEFGRKIPEDQIEYFRTVGDVIAFFEKG